MHNIETSLSKHNIVQPITESSCFPSKKIFKESKYFKGQWGLTAQLASLPTAAKIRDQLREWKGLE